MNALEQIERQLSESVAARTREDTDVVLSATQTSRRTGGTSATRWLRRRPAQLALVAGLAAVLLAVGLTSLVSTPGVTPAAAAALERLARIAASGPSLVPGPGQYLYVRSVSEYPAGGNGCGWSAVDHSQSWISTDGSGLLRDSTGPTTFTSAADQARCQKSDPQIDNAGETSNSWFAAGCLQIGPTNDMQSLSTDPSILLEQMRTLDGGPHTAAEDFVHVGDFLRGTDASPALRAALYRAAALIPGVQLLGVVKDHFGRPGLGVAMTKNNFTDELIFNSQTAALMGEQSTGSTTGFNSWAVYLGSSVVSSYPYKSPLELTPPCQSETSYSHNVPGGTVNTGARTAQTSP